MLSIFPFLALCGSAAAAPHVVVSLGSSYAAGTSLYRTYGKILADKLEGTFVNASQGGSLLADVPRYAARFLNRNDTEIITITAGGNDLNYVGCLNQWTKCTEPSATQSGFVDLWQKALNSTRDQMLKAKHPSPTTVPIYVVTYPQALTKDTICGEQSDRSKRTSCDIGPLAKRQLIESIYTKMVNWTVDGYDKWKKDNPTYNVRLLTMRAYSQNHGVGSQTPWLNGNHSGGPGGGDAWHPNPAGATFIAEALYANYKKTPFPAY